ncbi:hypothetical protein HanRHA438_Chr04g0201701 [Helianthus annuus]|nr:hypothetical protein HanHA300_Chr04g0157711 [Helianthus annuus]KAJ0759483.1 hypothetical protein HanLR1_Chr04g0161821 [Helianthus annuus]KAJ0763174.1 hypothetical protein HanOQP8_Chr04g0169301 [Helianthus annuus]KAJ0798261.1 hypothetical protein HanPI659440_Chr04g0182901 [Helianthus annuus]KAJ0929142.1 hypothetical protein HanRHA438_Chr04g0201701 [Helianthus annuus]
MENSKQTPSILSKQRSWSPDIHRDIEWQKLKNNQRRRFRHRRSKSIDGAATDIDITDDDVKELKACFDLGFGFLPCTDLDPKLSHAFPALEFYAAVNRQYNSRLLSRSSSLSSDSSSSSSSPSSVIIDPSDDPQKVKMRLKQWAQLVTCSVLESSSSQLANNKSVAE